MLQFGIFLHSLVVGFMIFFMAVVSPTIFKVLDVTNSGTFLRQLFPRMFLYGLIAMLLAFLTTLNSQLNIYWIISANCHKMLFSRVGRALSVGRSRVEIVYGVLTR